MDPVRALRFTPTPRRLILRLARAMTVLGQVAESSAAKSLAANPSFGASTGAPRGCSIRRVIDDQDFSPRASVRRMIRKGGRDADRSVFRDWMGLEQRKR